MDNCTFDVISDGGLMRVGVCKHAFNLVFDRLMASAFRNAAQVVLKKKRLRDGGPFLSAKYLLPKRDRVRRSRSADDTPEEASKRSGTNSSVFHSYSIAVLSMFREVNWSGTAPGSAAKRLGPIF